ncbi:hypothetical protein LXL04_021820 [Taraxacum kok-saghyz]
MIRNQIQIRIRLNLPGCGAFTLIRPVLLLYISPIAVDLILLRTDCRCRFPPPLPSLLFYDSLCLRAAPASAYCEGFLPFAVPVVMRGLAARFSSYLCRRRPVNVRSRQYSSSYERFPDEREIEEEAERKFGWLFKLLFVGTATIGGYHIFPYLGDNLIHQSVSLLNVKDPLFKRMGASRLARFATDDVNLQLYNLDERRMKIVELGGAKQLVEMLNGAKDDSTRKEALSAIIAIARSDEAMGALHSAGAISAIMGTPLSEEDAEIEKFKRKLLKRFRDMKYEESSS